MPDISSFLIRSSTAAPAHDAERCDDCRRFPLAGEWLHRPGGEGLLCDLCFATLPEERRREAPAHRVHASGGSLALVPRAA